MTAELDGDGPGAETVDQITVGGVECRLVHGCGRKGMRKDPWEKTQREGNLVVE